jgi:hypothetical protein
MEVPMDQLAGPLRPLGQGERERERERERKEEEERKDNYLI